MEINLEQEQSIIKGFYKDSVIFFTGSTGFLGKVLLEKILRCCEVNKIYLLIRDKKGQFAKERFEKLFKSPVFDKLKETKPNFRNYVALVEGDLSQEDLGSKKLQKFFLKMNSINIVLHIAATIRFDQNLKTALKVNVKATKCLIEMCKDLKLKAFIYTSSAYSNCDKNLINEVIYKRRFETHKLLKFLEDFDDNFALDITTSLLDKFPNTYVFSKGATEELILDYFQNKDLQQSQSFTCFSSRDSSIPFVIVRPSILSSTYNEPYPGWIDSWFTVGSISVATSFGLLRTANTDPEKIADIVPTDYVANCIIASALIAKSNNGELPILNYVSSVEAPITWGDYTTKCFQLGLKFIPSKCYRYPYIYLSKYRWVYLLRKFYQHTLPGIIIDLICFVLRLEFRVKPYFDILHEYLEATAYFSTRQWKFTNGNVQKLWMNLNDVDKSLFPFSMEDFNWDDYILKFLKNGRIYLLKDQEENLPRARKRLQILKIFHYFWGFVEVLVLFYIFKVFFF